MIENFSEVNLLQLQSRSAAQHEFQHQSFKPFDKQERTDPQLVLNSIVEFAQKNELSSTYKIVLSDMAKQLIDEIIGLRAR